MMKRVLLAMVLFSGTFAFAQGQGKQHNVLGDLSFSAGGMHFGAGYEYLYNGAQGIGGHLQMFQKRTATPTLGAANGHMVLGAMTGFHFFKGDWDFALSPSFNIINVDTDAATPGDKTTIGPGLSLALTTAITGSVALGFNYQVYYIWFGEDAYRGPVLSDLSVRVKVGF